jgi:hypothetical protein
MLEGPNTFERGTRLSNEETPQWIGISRNRFWYFATLPHQMTHHRKASATVLNTYERLILMIMR